MNFAAGMLTVLLVGAVWTVIGVRLWCGPSSVDELEADPEVVARRIQEVWHDR